MPESGAVCQRFRGLKKDSVVRIFGLGRTFRRGQKFAREGYLNVDVTLGEADDAVVKGFCFASQTKKKKHKLFVAIDLGNYSIIQSNCTCAAGRGKCSHVCGVFQYLRACGSFSRSLTDGEDELSCTSRPRQWGIPSRRVEPSVPVQDLQFKKVTEKEFDPISARSECEEESVFPSHSLPSLQQLRDDLRSAKKPSAFQRYFHPGESSSDSDNDVPVSRNAASSASTSTPLSSSTAATVAVCTTTSAQTTALPSVAEKSSSATHRLQSQFDQRRPKPLQYPSSLSPLLERINSADREQVEVAHVKLWCEEMESLLCLSEAQRLEVCRSTSQQSQSALWYSERVCRLTASNFGLVCKRRPGYMSSLVKHLLYVEPPVTVSAIRLGRQKEPVIVEKYVATMQKEETLVAVYETGLHVHPTAGFLAASPDRLVEDYSCEPAQGVLEVKYLASVVGPPEDALAKPTICLEQLQNGTVHLKKSHNYFYQVQGQMACTQRSWCDFVCMTSTGHLFRERISFDAEFWSNCHAKLQYFFQAHLAPEIVYPEA